MLRNKRNTLSTKGLLLTLILFSCSNRSEKGFSNNARFENKISIISSFGEINIDVPAPFYSKTWYENADNERANSLIVQQYRFVHNNDTGELEISFPLVILEHCFNVDSMKDLHLEVMEQFIRVACHDTGIVERRIIDIDNVKLYGVFFNSGFYLKGCNNEALFEIKLFDVKDSSFKKAVLNSIEIR